MVDKIDGDTACIIVCTFQQYCSQWHFLSFPSIFAETNAMFSMYFNSRDIKGKTNIEYCLIGS